MGKVSETRDTIVGLVIVGAALWWWFGSGESEADKAQRVAEEKAESELLAATPEAEKWPKLVRKALIADQIEVTTVGREIRVTKTMKNLLDDWYIFQEIQNDIAKILKASRKHGVDISSKRISLSMGAPTVDRYGNPSGAETAATVRWNGTDLAKVSDSNVLIYAMNLAADIDVKPVGRKAAIKYCTEGTIHSPPEHFCRLAVGSVFLKN